jgi:hypothetical protein
LLAFVDDYRRRGNVIDHGPPHDAE